jgi:hypothetical protein
MSANRDFLVEDLHSLEIYSPLSGNDIPASSIFLFTSSPPYS